MCVIYRVYDRDGALLYIGKTIQPWALRLSEHRKKKAKWIPRMAYVKLRGYANDMMAIMVERRAISILEPEFNVKDRREFQMRESEKWKAENPDFPSPFRGEPMVLLEMICGPQEGRIRETIYYT